MADAWRRRVSIHASGTPDIWMFAPDEPAIRVTDNPDWDGDPVWSRDGTYIVYASRWHGRWQLYRRNPTAIAPEELLLASDTPITPLQTVSENDVIYAGYRHRLIYDGRHHYIII
jgi:Tol biopolymer transport system component